MTLRILGHILTLQHVDFQSVNASQLVKDPFITFPLSQVPNSRNQVPQSGNRVPHSRNQVTHSDFWLDTTNI